MYVGAFLFLVTGRIGISGSRSFSCESSVGGEVLFWINYFILCLSVILFHRCNAVFITFWYLSVGSLCRVGKCLTYTNAWTFSKYVSVFTTTNFAFIGLDKYCIMGYGFLFRLFCDIESSFLLSLFIITTI